MDDARAAPGVAGADGATAEQWIRRIALAGVLAVLVVIAASAYLRLTAAGLGCADWPACYGMRASTPAQPAHPAVRLTHRVSASLAGLAVLAVGAIALRHRQRFRRELGITALLLVITIALSALGRATPGAELPAVALGNVLGGMLMASALFWLALGPPPQEAGPPARLRMLSWSALVLVFAQSALGVLTSASISGLVCTSLPLCTPDGPSVAWSLAAFDPWSTETERAALHMAHRGAALVAAGAVLALALSRGIGLRVRSALLQLLVLELILGLLLVAFSLPLAAAVAHNVGAALLLLALVAAHHGAFPKARVLI